MVTYLRTHLQRTRDDREHGSLILDILIGMAIFALIAFIAATAVNQYRMRAYIQAAVSDATQAANALSAHLTDQITGGDGDPFALISTTRALDAAEVSTLGVNRTSQGGYTSAIWVVPGTGNVEHFRTCVEYRGAFAIYDVDGGGMIDSGDAAKKNFPGCATGDAGAPGDGDDDALAGSSCLISADIMVGYGDDGESYAGITAAYANVAGTELAAECTDVSAIHSGLAAHLNGLFGAGIFEVEPDAYGDGAESIQALAVPAGIAGEEIRDAITAWVGATFPGATIGDIAIHV